MGNIENNPRNECETDLTSFNFIDHIKEIIKNHWIILVWTFLGSFGVFWGLVEAFNFFFPQLNLNSFIVFLFGIFIAVISALTLSVLKYINTPSSALIKERKDIQKIAIYKKPYWEYKLAYELINDRIRNIDQKLDDLLNNRIIVKVCMTMDIEEYVNWLNNRPENLLRLLDITTHLLIYDLLDALQVKRGTIIDLYKLVRIADLVGQAYQDAYNFSVEDKQIMVPDHCDEIHKIQSEWILLIRDGYKQMLKILHTISMRNKDDLSPINATISFNGPDNMDQFERELMRIEKLYTQI